MPRLFVAFAIPDALRTELSFMRGGLENARSVEPGDYHVTLRFVGDIDNADADRLAAALETVEAPRFTARLDGLATFGGDKPRLVHVGLKLDDLLRTLQQKIEAACRQAGLPAESRKFAPHITLARLRGQKPDVVAQWLSARSMPEPSSFPVDKFSLFSAKPGGGGPYRPVVDYPLSGS